MCAAEVVDLEGASSALERLVDRSICERLGKPGDEVGGFEAGGIEAMAVGLEVAAPSRGPACGAACFDLIGDEGVNGLKCGRDVGPGDGVEPRACQRGLLVRGVGAGATGSVGLVMVAHAGL